MLFRRRAGARGAFTLVELLVVIAIVGMLAVLQPVCDREKGRVLRSTCKRIGKASAPDPIGAAQRDQSQS